MRTPGNSDPEAKIEVSRPTDRHYVLRLYVTGSTPHSERAVTNLRKFCEEHLVGCYELEIHDISQNPSLAARQQIVAAPTLIKTLPLPPRRFIGDMSHTERLLLGLDVQRPEAMNASAQRV